MLTWIPARGRAGAEALSGCLSWHWPLRFWASGCRDKANWLQVVRTCCIKFVFHWLAQWWSDFPWTLTWGGENESIWPYLTGWIRAKPNLPHSNFVYMLFLFEIKPCNCLLLTITLDSSSPWGALVLMEGRAWGSPMKSSPQTLLTFGEAQGQ